jgi:hypothetical protein
MKLKCVGGNCDGDTVDVDSYLGLGDMVRARARIEFKVVDFEESLQAFRDGKTPESLSVPYHYYKIEEFNFYEGGKIKFLIPMHWEIEDAIRHLLSK